MCVSATFQAAEAWRLRKQQKRARREGLIAAVDSIEAQRRTPHFRMAEGEHGSGVQQLWSADSEKILAQPKVSSQHQLADDEVPLHEQRGGTIDADVIVGGAGVPDGIWAQ